MMLTANAFPAGGFQRAYPQPTTGNPHGSQFEFS